MQAKQVGTPSAVLLELMANCTKFINSEYSDTISRVPPEAATRRRRSRGTRLLRSAEQRLILHAPPNAVEVEDLVGRSRALPDLNLRRSNQTELPLVARRFGAHRFKPDR